MVNAHAVSPILPLQIRWVSHSVAINGTIILFNAILWTFVLGALRTERAFVMNAAMQRNDSLVIALGQYVVRTIESADAVIRYLIRERGRHGDKLDLTEFVEKHTIDYPALAGVVLANERGDAVATYPGAPTTLTNVADREHFKVHIERDIGKAVVGKPVAGGIISTSIIPISRRLNNADGTFGGVAMALMSPARFTEVLQNTQMLPRDVASLVGLDGITRARLVGDVASSGEDVGAGPLFAQLPMMPVGHAIAKGRLDGVARLYSYRTLKDQGLIAVVGRAQADVMAEFNARQTLYLWSESRERELSLGRSRMRELRGGDAAHPGRK